MFCITVCGTSACVYAWRKTSWAKAQENKNLSNPGLKAGAIGLKTGAIGLKTGAIGLKAGAIGLKTGAIALVPKKTNFHCHGLEAVVINCKVVNGALAQASFLPINTLFP